MAKRIHHMGMIVAKGEHDEFHKRLPELNPRQHEALMKRLGVTKEEDEEWHRTHLTLAQQRAQGLKVVEPRAIGIALAERCVQQGWMEKRGEEYFVSKQGMKEIRRRFDISL
jgi:hypothetical protein